MKNMCRIAIIFLMTYGIMCNIVIKSSHGDIIYPFNQQQDNYCKSQKNIIQFQNFEPIIVSYPQQFTVTVYAEKDNVLLLGLAKSQPVEGGHYQAKIIIQAHCRVSTYIVSRFNAAIVIKPQSFWNNQKSEKATVLQLPALLYCMNKSQIPTLQTLTLLGYWSIWAFMHAFLDIPPILSLPFIKRIFFVIVLLASYFAPTKYRHFIELSMVYFLGIYISNESYYLNNRNIIRLGYRIGWAILSLVSLCFILIEFILPNFGATFFFLNEILSMERVVVIFSMLIFIVRLRQMCIIIGISAIIKMEILKSLYNYYVINMPTPFPGDCLTYPILTILLFLPIVHYLRSIMPKYQILGSFVVFSLAYQGLTQRIIYIFTILIIVAWLVLLSAIKSPNYVINYNRSVL